MSSYNISPAGISFVKNEEGCRLKSYLDQVGVWTIGYGHTGPDVKPGQYITEARAQELLVLDLAKCANSINKSIKKPLTQDQVDALHSFIFNVGVAGFEGSTLLRVINADPASQQVGVEMNRWNKGTVDGKKVPLTVLTARRKRETALYYK